MLGIGTVLIHKTVSILLRANISEDEKRERIHGSKHYLTSEGVKITNKTFDPEE
jgi:hypothetical protein